MSPVPSFDREKDHILRQIAWFKPKGSMLAGGAITSIFTNQKIADFDLYFKSKEAFVEAVRDAYENGMWCLSNSGRAITFSDNGTIYQLMHFAFFPTPQEIFDSFDFTCCMAALDLDSEELTFHPTFLSDTSKRDLVFNHRTEYPLASAMRVLKYQEKGYTVRKVEMLKIITACNLRPAKDWGELADQIGGRYCSAAKVDGGIDFTLDNVIAAIESLTDSKTVEGPGGADEALLTIFGEQEAAA